MVANLTDRGADIGEPKGEGQREAYAAVLPRYHATLPPYHPAILFRRHLPSNVVPPTGTQAGAASRGGHGRSIDGPVQ